MKRTTVMKKDVLFTIHFVLSTENRGRFILRRFTIEAAKEREWEK
ncbi:hypothetical protein [Halobacillus kuroshimensis]|nr:hypothetical protein [Halobacillus kuroshimensis]